MELVIFIGALVALAALLRFQRRQSATPADWLDLPMWAGDAREEDARDELSVNEVRPARAS